MLEAFTIFTTGGLVLYHYRANPSLVGDDNDGSMVRTSCNAILLGIVLQNPTKNFHIDKGVTFSWKQYRDCFAVAVYPDILFEGPRQYLKGWAETLIGNAMDEYSLFYRSTTKQDVTKSLILARPDPEPFDRTFRVLLDQSKNQRPTATAATATAEQPTEPAQQQASDNTTTKSGGGKGKEKRQWHDGKAKVTDKAMAELDMSAPAEEGDKQEALDRALQEARKTYLPSESELLQEQQENENNNGNNKASDGTDSSSWSASVTGLLQQLAGNKVLTDSDLDKPLEQMRDLLTSKNVARDIAEGLCDEVRVSIKGKKLNSLYRVQTAVQQAMEKAVTRLLNKKDVDLVRAVLTKRGDGSLFGRSSSSNKAPYVIVVMGINGIGKTTSLAKLAYHLSNNGCKPLLVAGDTFRSGAVEQLQVHATCLDVSLFSQGYAKDPSAVAKAAIAHATEHGNDVVLMDTAGRMQSNVPLMKALGKLVKENSPDCILLVAEALVGHDGLDQYQMFSRALGPSRNVDGLILTKYDTVSDKVGAALTLTHETGAPIVFVGTGQKYHHLKRLSVTGVINSLFS